MAIVPRYNSQVTPNANTTPVGATATDDAAFGAGLGAALQGAGQTSEGIGAELQQHAIQMQTLDNKAASDGASVALNQAQRQAMLDFQDKNPGIAAVNNLPQFYKQLDTLREQYRSNMTNPMTRSMYDEATRLNTDKIQGAVATWANQQRKEYNVHQYQSMADNIARGATRDNIDEVMKEAEPQFHAMGVELGWSPEEFKNNYENFIGKTVYGLVAGTAAKDPNGAQDTLDKYGKFLSPQEKGVLQNQIQSSVDNHLVASVANEKLSQSLNSGGFARFATREAGLAAADSNLASYGSKYGINTISGVINRWAPPSENDTQSYIATVAKATGYGPNQKIDLSNKTVRQKLLVAMAAVEKGGNNNPLNLRPHNFPGELPPSAAQMNGLDAAEDNAPATLASFETDPRFHGDPVLINRAQSLYLENLRQDRAAENLATQSRLDRLWTAAMQSNISDPAKLQQAYPGASQDWAALGGHAQQRLTAQLSTFGNQHTPDRDANFLTVRGGILNPSTASQYTHMDLSGMDLTRQQYTSLREMQQNAIARAAKIAQMQANVTSALNLEPVKQALDKRPDLKPGSSEYNQFTGALSASIEEWITEHPGKKPSEADKASMAASLLAKKPAHYVNFPFIKTTIAEPVVPPEAEAAIRAQVEPNIGRPLMDFEVGRLYIQGKHRAR